MMWPYVGIHSTYETYGIITELINLEVMRALILF